ncbi:uridine kinase [bacterium SCSIO 12741]|nr:uridine kinase [bacterium SCSIO 12741]
MSLTPYIVGIAGGSASGKTSFIRDIRNALPKHSLAVISQDHYYLPKEKQQQDENGWINFDLPTSIDRQTFLTDILRLKEGHSIVKTEYTFNNADKEPEEIVIQPAPIVVMEGLFVFHYEEIRKLLDLRVYLDVREDIKLQRRIKRDAEERGYPEHEVRYQWDNHVTPSYKKYLRPYRDDAHVIITNNTSYNKGLDVLLSHLRSKIS